MTKEYFNNNVVMAIEIEYEAGGRCWYEVKGSEVKDFCDKLKQMDGEYLSDIDYCTKQEDPEIRKILDEANEIWMEGFKGENDSHEKFNSFNELIDSFLTEDKPKKIWSEDEIKDLVQTNDKVLYGALKKLYAEQTEDEKMDGETKHNNGAGFNGIDAKFLSSVAEFLIKTGFLTDKQKAITRKKLVKYNKQLTRLANA